MPGGEVQVAEVPFVVERGQPVDSVDWASGGPIFKKTLQRLCVWRPLDVKHFYSLRAK